MQFNNLADFIAMGGHGFYVWLVYGVSLALLFGLIFVSKYKHAAAKQQILKRLKREEKLKQAAQMQNALTKQEKINEPS